MNELIQSQAITELHGTPNVQYVLSEKSLFSLTEYKVLKNQDANFIECAKVMYNGKIKLIYFTSNHKSLRNMIPSLDEDMFLSVIANVFNTIIQIKNNGFLSCPNLDLSFDKIFVDPIKLTVSLIYLPVNSNQLDMATFENELRTETIKLISGIPTFASEKITRVSGYLSNGTLTLPQLYKKIASEIKGVVRINNMSDESSQKRRKNTSSSTSQPTLILDAINAPEKIRFVIDKLEFVIGRSVTHADGVISFNKAVGRTHCTIIYQDATYYIADLGSANGTFINGKRLVPQKINQINDGDVIKIANTEFKAQI